MEAGRIVERGSFRELMAQDGRFAQMWRLQQEESEKTEPGAGAGEKA
jgi:ATP-binding cassette subfamily B protein